MMPAQVVLVEVAAEGRRVTARAEGVIVAAQPRAAGARRIFGGLGVGQQGD
jgi:hypothetical protein